MSNHYQQQPQFNVVNKSPQAPHSNPPQHVRRPPPRQPKHVGRSLIPALPVFMDRQRGQGNRPGPEAIPADSDAEQAAGDQQSGGKQKKKRNRNRTPAHTDDPDDLQLDLDLDTAGGRSRRHLAATKLRQAFSSGRARHESCGSDSAGEARPQQRRSGGGGAQGRQRRAQPKPRVLSRAQTQWAFMRAHYRLVVRPAAFPRYAQDPDAAVDWQDVLLVIGERLDHGAGPAALAHADLADTSCCPICLEEPVAPKITRCCHVFCSACLLHYFAEEEDSSCWMPCPQCRLDIRQEAVRPLIVESKVAAEIGSELQMTLVRRYKGCVVPFCANRSLEVQQGTAAEQLPAQQLDEQVQAAMGLCETELHAQQPQQQQQQQQQQAGSEPDRVATEHCVEWWQQAHARGGPPTSAFVLHRGTRAPAFARTLIGLDLRGSLEAEICALKQAIRSNTPGAADADPAVAATPVDGDLTPEDSAAIRAALRELEDGASSWARKIAGPSQPQQPLQTQTAQSQRQQLTGAKNCGAPAVAAERTEEQDETLLYLKESLLYAEQHLAALEQQHQQLLQRRAKLPVRRPALQKSKSLPLAASQLLRNGGGQEPPDEDGVWFYQAADGQLIFLHPLSFRMLQHEYGAVAQFPTSIRGRVVDDVAHVSGLGAATGFRFLSHLSADSRFRVVLLEVACDREDADPSADSAVAAAADGQPRFGVSRSTFLRFQPLLQQAREERRHRMEQERRLRDRAAKRAEQLALSRPRVGRYDGDVWDPLDVPSEFLGDDSLESFPELHPVSPSAAQAAADVEPERPVAQPQQLQQAPRAPRMVWGQTKSGYSNVAHKGLGNDLWAALPSLVAAAGGGGTQSAEPSVPAGVWGQGLHRALSQPGPQQRQPAKPAFQASQQDFPELGGGSDDGGSDSSPWGRR